MRVLVTGSAGFIGQHLVRHLTDEGYIVTGLDRRIPHDIPPGVDHVECDLLDADALRRAVQASEPAVVVHLAAITHLNGTTLDAYAPNLAGVSNLIAAIAAMPSVRRVVCTSSQLVRRLGGRPASHDEDYDPSTLYGESKVETERIWRSADGAGREWCLVRPTTIWGPGMNPHYLTFLRMIQAGRYVHVGDASIRKTYGFIGNTIRQYQKLIDAPPASMHRRTFYLGDYEPIDLRAWAEQFRAVLDAPRIRTISMRMARAIARSGDLINAAGFRRFPFNSFRLNNVITPNVVNLSTTREVCGEVPFTSRDGVKLTVEWLLDERAIVLPSTPPAALARRRGRSSGSMPQ